MEDKYKRLVNNELYDYIKINVMPLYDKPSVDDGHRRDHIDYVVNRSMNFASDYNIQNSYGRPVINFDMVYTVASYHDVGLAFGSREDHADNSAKYLLSDKGLDEFFSSDEIFIMGDAVAQHRASYACTPSTIYGKIVSQADRDTDLDSILYRTFVFRCNKEPYVSDFNELKRDVLKHLSDKYTSSGYASSKIWFKDIAFEKFVNEVEDFVKQPDRLDKRLRKLIKSKDPEKYDIYFGSVTPEDVVKQVGDLVDGEINDLIK